MGNVDPWPSEQEDGLREFANMLPWHKLKELEGGCHLPLLLTVLKGY